MDVAEPPENTLPEGGATGTDAVDSSPLDSDQQNASAGPPESVKKPEESKLDLAFAMDCTGSMGSYIRQAQMNIRRIVEEIVAAEKAQVRLALVKYRDHPPQDSSFVTDTHDFTESVREMKGWLDQCSAAGGGDRAEAVADALHQVLKLDWRQEAVKICVLIADAPPHGLHSKSDGFPDGCPSGLDPMEITKRLAEKGVVLYMVGCEPSITRYKDFFMALTHLTGGQYVPLGSARVLAKVIIGGAQEEISLQKLMKEVNQEVITEYATFGGDKVDDEALSHRVHEKLVKKGAKSHQLLMKNSSLPTASMAALKLSESESMDHARSIYERNSHHYEECIPPERGAKKKKSKGAHGFFKNLFRSGEPSGGNEVHSSKTEAGAAAGRDSSMDEDIYNTTTNAIHYDQARRMVQRSVMSHNLKPPSKKS